MIELLYHCYRMTLGPIRCLRCACVHACAYVTEREILCLYLYDVQQSEQSDAQKMP